jgi:pantoate--beta-alanine ligase
MKVISNITELRALIAVQKASGVNVALVPTMGNLHDGHLSLVKKAKEDKNFVVTSIFVNPIQFGPSEDYNSYPRTLDADVEKIKQYCDIVFAPSVTDMYTNGSACIVTETEKSSKLCGRFRPGHFDGVLTVVLKLFNICSPNIAYFGLKDYQQFILLRDMASKFDLDIKVVGCPLVREKDGLALSSRNSYMDATQRSRALALSESLRKVKELFDSGEKEVTHLKAKALEVLLPRVEVQYFEVVDADSLDTVKTVSKGNVVLVAAFCDQVRLIDNIIL